MTPMILIAALLLAPQKALDSSANRSWTQPLGNAWCTSRVDVDPVRSEPTSMWEKEVGAPVGDPVTWDGIAYLASKTSSGYQIQMWEIASGDSLGTGALGKTAPLAIVCWDDWVGVALPDGVHMMQLNAKDKKLADVRILDAQPDVAPRVVGGMLYASTATDLRIFDFKFGNLRGTLDLARGSCGMRLGGEWGPPIVAGVVLDGAKASLRVVEVSGLAGAKIDALGTSAVELGGASPEALDGSVLVRLQPKTGGGAWVLVPSGELTTTDGAKATALLVREGGSAIAAPFVGGIASEDGSAIGFDAQGALVRLETSGSASTIVPADAALPRGPITIARGVAYVGGRAIDLNTGKSLWSYKKGAAGDRRLIPAGDQRLLVVERTKLVCYGLRGAAKSAPAASGPVVTKPGSSDGVIHVDGSRYAGSVAEVEGGGWKVESEGGRSYTLEAADVAAVESGGEFKLVGPEIAVHRAWLAALNAEHRERLVEVFNTFLKARLLDDCKRVLDEAKRCGLEKARVVDLTAKMAATKPNEASNLEGQRKSPLNRENVLRKQSREGFEKAAAWCASKGLRLTATLLYGSAEAAAPAGGRADALVQPLIPEAFPWVLDPNGVSLWKAWAAKLIRSGAEFVPQEDPAWRKVRMAPWTNGAWILRTSNVILYSRDDTQEVVGACLDAAEYAMRILRRIAPPDPDVPHKLLEVRLSYDRAEYLKDRSSGSLPPAWTAGFYSPGDRISRFYVPRGDEAKDYLGRGMFAVVSHELTHHYLDLAWLSPTIERKNLPGPDQPGYWVVEGMAQFIEDQVATSLRAEAGLEQRDAVSAYLCKAVGGVGKLIPAARMIDLPQSGFATLKDEELCRVPLPEDGTRAMILTERGIFYEQAGCVVFYLMYRCGPDVRAKLAAYLRATYTGKTEKEGWKTLGFETAGALDSGFRDFILATNR